MHRLFILALFVAGCGANGHLEPAPFRASAGDNVVNCNCNLSFQHSACVGGNCYAHFPIQVCVPPELRKKEMTDDAFASRMDKYCRDTVTNMTYHLIQVFAGGFCEYKQPFAPQGGIGDSVFCFANAIEGKEGAATTTAATCERSCPAVPCAWETNCGDDVQDDTGGIHLERCRCSQVTVHSCAGDPKQWLPTPVFCRP
jgi:hypothetical protein